MSSQRMNNSVQLGSLSSVSRCFNAFLEHCKWGYAEGLIFILEVLNIKGLNNGGFSKYWRIVNYTFEKVLDIRMLIWYGIQIYNELRYWRCF